MDRVQESPGAEKSLAGKKIECPRPLKFVFENYFLSTKVDPQLTSRGVVPEFDRHYDSSVRAAEAAGKKHSVYPALFWTFGPMFFSGEKKESTTFLG